MLSRILIVFLFSCLWVTPVTAGDTNANNKDVVRLYFEQIINRQQTDLVPLLISEDFVHFNNGSRAGKTGPEAVLKAIREHKNANTEYAFHLEALYEADDKIIAQWLWKSTNIKFGPPRQVTADGISIFELKDGKISKLWQVFDVLGFMKQLGFTLTPSPNPEEGQPAD
jgi:hypothetical protein